MSVDIGAINLTNEMQRQYYHSGEAGNQQITNFGTVQVGRSVSAALRWKM
jgi:iron complex outermembrane receptor protein